LRARSSSPLQSSPQRQYGVAGIRHRAATSSPLSNNNESPVKRIAPPVVVSVPAENGKWVSWPSSDAGDPNAEEEVTNALREALETDLVSELTESAAEDGSEGAVSIVKSEEEHVKLEINEEVETSRDIQTLDNTIAGKPVSEKNNLDQTDLSSYNPFLSPSSAEVPVASAAEEHPSDFVDVALESDHSTRPGAESLQQPSIFAIPKLTFRRRASPIDKKLGLKNLMVCNWVLYRGKFNLANAYLSNFGRIRHAICFVPRITKKHFPIPLSPNRQQHPSAFFHLHSQLLQSP
jgi:hypothetical protein